MFPGSSGNYKEEDRTDPVNKYGISKKIGEEMLNGRKNIILRISTPYGINYSLQYGVLQGPWLDAGTFDSLLEASNRIREMNYRLSFENSS